MTEADVARFWSKVDTRAGHGPRGDCWVWTAALAVTGYPNGFVVLGKTFRASHVALMLDNRPRPSLDLIALHNCDNKVCVNPAHLRWGTDAENHEDHRQRGERGARWLADDTVREILRSDERNTDIAHRLGLSASTICNIRKGRFHRNIFEEYCRTAAKPPEGLGEQA